MGHLNILKVTLDNVGAVGGLVVSFLVIPAKYKYLVGVERSPSTATEQGKVAFYTLNHRVDFYPLVWNDVVDFDVVIILAVGKNAAQFQKVITANRCETRVDSCIFWWFHSLGGIDWGIKNLQLLEHIIVSHTPHNVDQSSKAAYRVAASRMFQVSNGFEDFGARRILVNFRAFPFCLLVSASNQVYDSLLGSNSSVERGKIKLNPQRNNFPFGSVVRFEVSDF